jgi:CsoR family transcriptional regulator, copper-sensing transcriptional repressor
LKRIWEGAVSEKTYGYHDRKPELIGRLNRIEGQVRGVKRMVDEDTYCIDILTQIAAATNALRKVAIGLLEDHIAHCVTTGAAGNEREGALMVKEASAAIERLVRS